MEAEGEACLRLDRPPPLSSKLTLAESFGRHFAIFADAEEEFDWGRPFSRDSVSVRAIAAVPPANERLRALGGWVTYLCDYPVADDPAAAETMRALHATAACDIGAQLHPWVTPPFREILSERSSFAGNLPRDLEAAKITALTGRIEESVGVRPIVFRAGRYGAGPNTATLLTEHGYRLDASVRALFDYGPAGPDFRFHPATPFRIARDLVEVPLGVTYTGRLRRFGGLLHRLAPLRGPLAWCGLVSRVALTPEGIPLKEACEAVRVMLGEGQRLLSLSFHTPSLEAGHTPYVRDAADLATFWRWWEGVLGLLAREGVTACRPDDILAAVNRPISSMN